MSELARVRRRVPECLSLCEHARGSRRASEQIEVLQRNARRADGEDVGARTVSRAPARSRGPSQGLHSQLKALSETGWRPLLCAADCSEIATERRDSLTTRRRFSFGSAPLRGPQLHTRGTKTGERLQFTRSRSAVDRASLQTLLLKD